MRIFSTITILAQMVSLASIALAQQGANPALFVNDFLAQAPTCNDVGTTVAGIVDLIVL